MSKMSKIQTKLRAAAVLSQVKKPLKRKLDALCVERSETLETLVHDLPLMIEVFAYVWEQFPTEIRQAIDKNFFVQSCMQERHRLVSELKGGKPKKVPFLERLRQKKSNAE